MALAKGSVEVTVFRVGGEVLADARVTLTPTGGVKRGRPAALKFDRGRGTHRRAGVAPGRYTIRADAEGVEPDAREVLIAGDVRETFVLGAKAMPHYYRGRVRVPFEPHQELIAVSLAARIGEADEAQVAHVAAGLGLRAQAVADQVRADGVRLFSFEKRVSAKRRREVEASLGRHSAVRRVGTVVALGRESVSFLTDELVASFEGDVSREEADRIATKLGLEVLRAIPYAGNAYLLRSRSAAGYELLHLCDRLLETGRVEWAEPNLVSTTVDDFTPDDPLLSDQPHHPLIGSEAAWDVTTGSDAIIVAVVDSGCETTHADFTNPPAAGWTKIYSPFDFTAYDTDPTGGSHGTKSCGIAAAVMDNAEGVAGMAGGCRLMPLKYPSGGTDVEYADAYVWISGGDPGSTTPGFPAPISPGADVISSSYGIPQPSLPAVMRDAFDYATTYGRGGRGCVVVFSVGNDNLDFTTYRQWAAYEKTIAVASSAIAPPDPAEVKVSTSNFGSKVDVCAPGGGPGGGAEARTMSTTIGGYADFGQTSCACPQVAGTAALMLSANPDLSWVEVRELLRGTAVRIDSANTDPVGMYVDNDGDGVAEYSQWYGYGRIDAGAAVAAADAYSHDREVIVRDNLADTGLVPSGGVFWNSPDVWVRTGDPVGDAGALPASYADPGPHQSPAGGQDNWVYVRYRNLGTADSLAFYVRVYIAHYPGFEFVYPDGFEPTNAGGTTPVSPLQPGTYLIGEAARGPLAAGASETITVPWPAALVPPQTVDVSGSTVNWHPCLLVEVSPHEGPPSTGVHVWDDNNLAQKNISITYPDDDGHFAAAAVMGAPSEPGSVRELVVDRGKVPPEVRLYVRLLDPRVMRRLRPPAPTRPAARPLPAVAGGFSAVLEAMPKMTHEAFEIAIGRHLYNYRLGNLGSQTVAFLADRGRTRIPIEGAEGALIPLVVGGVAPKRPRRQRRSYEVRLQQLDGAGHVTGAVGLQVTV